MPEDAMHLIVPFAVSGSPAWRKVFDALQLPNLATLLARLSPGALDAGSETSLSPPHERALARALGLPVDDGRIPWAAWEVAARGGAAGNAGDAWAWITPCSWQVGVGKIAMGEVQGLQLEETESRALLAAMEPYFVEDGIALQFSTPTRWLARGEVFRNLATASLDRVSNRLLEPWMPHDPAAVPLLRLQNEMQMLLYTHTLSDARAARGLPAVNSFWISGAGALSSPAAAWGPAMSPEAPAPHIVQPTSLRDAALREDWAAYGQAWQQLDANELAALLAALERGEAARLTLCGERSAQVFEPVKKGLWERISSIFGRESPSSLMEQL